MRTLFFSLMAVAVALTGCDSDPVQTAAGPTIQFAAQSANVSEDAGTVLIDVTLAGAAAGETYTVEVLYASAASSTDYGDDVAAFGAAEGPNYVATVSLTGPSDTETVTIDIVDDGEVEAAEAAVFVLQRASGGAEIGANREFRLEIGTPPIASVRAREVGSTVTVEGIVTSTQNRYTFVQDETGGITVYDFEDTPFGEAVARGDVRVGDRVVVAGALEVFSGLTEVVDVTDFRVLSRDNPLPAAQRVTIAQLLAAGDALESERVRIEGLTVTNPAGAVVFDRGNQTVSDGTGSLTLRNQFGSTLVGELVPSEPFTYIGPVGQFSGVNQLSPLSACEVLEVRATTTVDCSAFED